MDERLSISQAKIRFHELVRGLAERDVLLLRHGQPLAVMLSYDTYRALLEGLDDLEGRLAVYEAREEGSDSWVRWSGLKAAADLN